jgi:hypothetical protein
MRPGPAFAPLLPLDIQDARDSWDVILKQRAHFLTRIDQPLVLISQVQRSGGTLISQLLDGHSQLHVHPSELRVGPTKRRWPSLDLTPPVDADALFEALHETMARRHARRGYEKLGEAVKEGGADVAEHILPFVFLFELQGELFRRLIRERPPGTQREALNAYVTSYFNAWLDYQGLYKPAGQVRYWAAFAARLLAAPGNIEAFLADYPDGRIISPIRNPVSWYASARRHGPDYQDPAAAAELWLACNRMILDGLRDHPGLIMLVELEDLVTRTEEVMRQVAGFLGLDFEPVLLKPTFNGMDIASDSSFEPRYGVDPSSRDRSGDVEPQARALIEERTGPLYAQLRQAALAQAWTRG